MKVTLKDIAKKADVSVATVSIALNDKGSRIPEETRRKIKSIADELNYVPNYSARSLVLNKSNSIGLIIPDLINPFFSWMAKMAVKELRDRGYVCLIMDSNGLFEKDMELLDYLKARGVDGILFTVSNESYKYEDEIVNKINDLKIPTVLLDRELHNFPAVYFDNEHGGYIATESLIISGHTRIGMITGPLYSKSGQARYAGYKNALKDYGIKFDNELVVEGDYDFDAGFNNADHLIKKDVRAVVAANDMAAFGFIKKAKEHKWFVGEDYSIVGYDNLNITDVIDVPLTSVNQDISEIVPDAIEMLLSLIDGNEVDDSRVIQPTLVEKSSVINIKG